MSESTKSKIFLIVTILLILYAIGATYTRVYIQKDFLVMSEVSCDPLTESCFEYSPEDLCEESEDAKCIEETEAEYYKIIFKKAANVPFCEYNPELGESCPELMCEEGETEEDCYYEYCQEDCAEVKI